MSDPHRPPNITEEELRDAFLVGQHKRTASGAHLPALAAERETREWKRRAPEDRPLSAKWYMIMTMQMRALTNREICARLNMSENTLYAIQRSDRYRRVLESRMQGLDHEILALKPKAISALDGALQDSNKDTALRAARTFFEMTGQGTFGKGPQDVSGSVSAVALAKALVSEARASAEVHIHVGGRGETTSVSGLAPRASDVDSVPSVHGSSPGGLLPSPQGDCREDGSSGGEDGSQPSGVESHRQGDG